MPGMIQPERRVEWDNPMPLTGKIPVEVKSFFTGQWNGMFLDITREQWDAWQAGQYIQTAMPQLSPEQREFLLTGATPEEWDAEFGDDDE